MTPSDSRLFAAAIAAHRFGLGEPTLAPLADDPRGWLLAQIGPADAPRGGDARASAERLALLRRPAAERVEPTRALVEADLRERRLTAQATHRPFAERLAQFWANHFTVSTAKGAVRGLAGGFEREAIRPHVAGPFEQLLWAATTHPAMLIYLDNQRSAGPHSQAVARAARRAARAGEEPRLTGLNENLARELLELHTLGAGSGYTQADVTAFAALLTGWRHAPDGDDARPFDPAWHEPGPKTVLGRRYPEGPDALRLALRDLARHPATARHVSTQLARHLLAAEPPAALVDRLAARWQASEGHLGEVTRTLVESPEAWGGAPTRLKSPEAFVLATARLIEPGDTPPAPLERLLAEGPLLLGQRPQAAPSPAGWPDQDADWLGAEALWKRVEWTHRLAARTGRLIDARALAEASLGPWLGAGTRREIERAADAPQALALLLLAPEFQRR